jgi:regulator of sigma E protease
MQYFSHNVVPFIFVLGILVFVHEFGHYAVAKLFKVRVDTFSLGFGKRLIGFRRGDTDYRISLLPLGGYVKMAGENPMESRTGDPGEFMSHPRRVHVPPSISRVSIRAGGTGLGERRFTGAAGRPADR